jgi:hypothetical protein
MIAFSVNRAAFACIQSGMPCMHTYASMAASSTQNAWLPSSLHFQRAHLSFSRRRITLTKKGINVSECVCTRPSNHETKYICYAVRTDWQSEPYETSTTYDRTRSRRFDMGNSSLPTTQPASALPFVTKRYIQLTHHERV